MTYSYGLVVPGRDISDIPTQRNNIWTDRELVSVPCTSFPQLYHNIQAFLFVLYELQMLVWIENVLLFATASTTHNKLDKSNNLESILLTKKIF
jgi:hypothetical protein